MLCQNKAYGLDEDHADSKKLRQALIHCLEQFEGVSATWQINKDVSTRDLLVSEVARRTRLSEDQISHVPIAKLRHVFERTVSLKYESFVGYAKPSEIFAPALCAGGAAMSVFAGYKAVAVIAGFFAFIGGLNITGAFKDAKYAREKNHSEGVNLLATAQRQKAPSCKTGPCGACTL